VRLLFFWDSYAESQLVVLSVRLNREQAEEFAKHEAELKKVAGQIEDEKRSLATLQASTREMWARMQPRMLPVGTFLAALRGQPTGTAVILYQPDDQEAYNFAFSLWPVLGHARWTVQMPEPFRPREDPPFDRMPWGLAAGAQLNRGVTLVANSIGHDSRNRVYRALHEAFRACNFDIGGTLDASLGDNIVKILVGQKQP
jgi:hypothetical protein